ncbi:MAG: hypothetical protein EHM80_06140 [Nitrospiraceae bacterium]|nr:MAG: hypothetical protein EHM80_06140 [Nitrospiraceae bacterium]
MTISGLVNPGTTDPVSAAHKPFAPPKHTINNKAQVCRTATCCHTNLISVISKTINLLLPLQIRSLHGALASTAPRYAATLSQRHKACGKDDAKGLHIASQLTALQDSGASSANV